LIAQMKAASSRAIAVATTVGRLPFRVFDASFTRQDGEPAIALCGIDNAFGRRALDRVGFAFVVEAGLGRGHRDFRTIRLHTLPGSRPASDIWKSGTDGEDVSDRAAYQRMLQDGELDRCGVTLLAGKPRLRSKRSGKSLPTRALRRSASGTICRPSSWALLRPASVVISVVNLESENDTLGASETLAGPLNAHWKGSGVVAARDYPLALGKGMGEPNWLMPSRPILTMCCSRPSPCSNKARREAGPICTVCVTTFERYTNRQCPCGLDLSRSHIVLEFCLPTDHDDR
jgi:hypothetical protein